MRGFENQAFTTRGGAPGPAAPAALPAAAAPPLRAAPGSARAGRPSAESQGRGPPSEIRIHQHLQLGYFGTFGFFIFVCFGSYKVKYRPALADKLCLL